MKLKRINFQPTCFIVRNRNCENEYRQALQDFPIQTTSLFKYVDVITQYGYSKIEFYDKHNSMSYYFVTQDLIVKSVHENTHKSCQVLCHKYKILMLLTTRFYITFAFPFQHINIFWLLTHHHLLPHDLQQHAWHRPKEPMRLSCSPATLASLGMSVSNHVPNTCKEKQTKKIFKLWFLNATG